MIPFTAHKTLRSMWRKLPWPMRYWAVKNMWVPTLRHLNVLVTGQCNLRCEFCNIGGQGGGVPEADVNLTLDHFRNNLLGPKPLPSVNFVHLSGGEPFLRKDLNDLCDLFALRCPHAELSLATNGVLTDRIMQFCQGIWGKEYRRRLGIGISLDGIGEIHDQIRGASGTFRQVMQTLREVKKHFPGLIKSIGFTIIPQNMEYLPEVYRLARDNDLEFYFRPAQESPIYYGDNRGKLPLWDEAKLRELDRVIHGFLPDPAGGVNGVGTSSFFFRNMGSAFRIKKRYYDCFAGLCSVFIDSHGNIRPCMMLDVTLGNIAQDHLLQALKSPKARKIRRYIARRQCFCWVECETLNSWSVASWLGMSLRKNLRRYGQESLHPLPKE